VLSALTIAGLPPWVGPRLRDLAAALEEMGGPLPAADVPGFHGKIAGIVDSVDAEKGVLKVKVTKVEAGARLDKSPNT